MRPPPVFHTLVNLTEGRKYLFAVNHSLGKVTVTRVWLSDGETENMGTYPIDEARNLWHSLVEADGFVGEA